MASYGYTYRGGNATYNGVAAQSDGWSKTSYTSDHVSQAVIIDAEGRRTPIISYAPDGNNKSYVIKTEIVERVPLVTRYKQRAEVIGDYSPEKWDKSSSHAQYHAEEKWNRSLSPVCSQEKWNRPSSPIRHHDEQKWNKFSSPVHERPQQVEEFITKVQTKASQPNKFAPLSANYWLQDGQTPNSCHVNTHSSDHGDLSNKEWQKPSGNNIWNEKHDNPYKRDGFLEPTMTTIDGARTNPSHGAWSTRKGTKLSKPTLDTSTTKEAVKPSSHITPHSKHVIPAPTGPKRDTYTEKFDSMEAERRFGNLNLAYRPMDNYTRDIDSREAERKHGGVMINNYARSIDSTEAAIKYGGTIIDDYIRSIDSEEAARKYRGITNSDLAFRTMDNYTGIINNKEAARKYGGTEV